MKIGIDSYCFHRFFGEVYPEQPAPPKQMTMTTSWSSRTS